MGTGNLTSEPRGRLSPILENLTAAFDGHMPL